MKTVEPLAWRGLLRKFSASAKQLIWPPIKRIAILFLRVFAWQPYLRSQMVRKLVFDAAPRDRLLIAPWPAGSFVVRAGDVALGRPLYAVGALEVDKLWRALDYLGNFERDLFIDIGANTGFVSIPAVKSGLFQRAIAVEPEPFNFRLLCANIHLNGVAPQIVAHNVALGAREQDGVSLELSETNSGDHRIRLSADPGLFGEDRRETIRVKMMPLDQLIPSFDPRRTMIWMDTQGFEGHILAGARNALAARPPLVLEFWPYAMNRAGSYEPLKDALLAAGYSNFCDVKHGVPLGRLTESSLNELYHRLESTMKSVDLLFF
jgi:FkbM family methyltransferase